MGEEIEGNETEGQPPVPKAFPLIVISSEVEKSSLYTGQTKEVRGAVNTVLHTTWNDGLLHRYGFPVCKKDPSAALGMTKRGMGYPHSLSSRCGSQPPPLRGTSFQRKEGEVQNPSHHGEGGEMRIPLPRTKSLPLEGKVPRRGG